MAAMNHLPEKFNSLRKFISYRSSLFLEKQKAQLLKSLSAPTKTYDLVIIDDLVPKSLSGFRDYEFDGILKHYKNAALFTIIGNRISKKKALQYFHFQNTEQYKERRAAFEKAFGVPGGQLKPFFPWTKIRAKLAYVVFLTNADYLIEYLEERKIPFILELFPGGGFSELTEGPAFDSLKRVLSSPMLKSVLIPEGIVYRFVSESKLCDPDKISYFYGCLLSPDFMALPEKQIRYPLNKRTIDLCFVAAKNMPHGEDKGYDLFIEAAIILLSKGKQYHFHIVGGFNEGDIPIRSELKDHFHFYGFLKSKEFIPFYKDKDFFVSPNRAYVLGKGSSDGFPTGAGCEAGLHGLCLLISDPLGLNDIYGESLFRVGRDAVIIENEPDKIAEIVINLTKNPEDIYKIGNGGKIALRRLFDTESQLQYRFNLFNKFMK